MPTPAAESELITFLPFHFEVETGRLWSGDQLCALRPQAAAILEYLLRRPGQVVSKAELFSALWPGVSVSAGVLKTYIWEIRKALDHTRGSSQLVETLPRRGYRFIGEVQGPRSKVQGPTSALVATTDFDPLVPSPQSLAANVVGREAELAQLHEWWAQARKGERQVAFVTGEAGIGKTTLVDAFLRQVTSTGEALCIGRGQCIEHYGTGEAYMPVLEALGDWLVNPRLCHWSRRSIAMPRRCLRNCLRCSRKPSGNDSGSKSKGSRKIACYENSSMRSKR